MVLKTQCCIAFWGMIWNTLGKYSGVWPDASCKVCSIPEKIDPRLNSSLAAEELLLVLN